MCLPSDAALDETANESVSLTLSRFGRINILINNAGQGKYSRLVDTTSEDFDKLARANLRSGFVLSRAAAPEMIAQHSGLIIFVSSVAGPQGAANESVYLATKLLSPNRWMPNCGPAESKSQLSVMEV